MPSLFLLASLLFSFYSSHLLVARTNGYTMLQSRNGYVSEEQHGECPSQTNSPTDIVKQSKIDAVRLLSILLALISAIVGLSILLLLNSAQTSVNDAIRSNPGRFISSLLWSLVFIIVSADLFREIRAKPAMVAPQTLEFIVIARNFCALALSLSWVEASLLWNECQGQALVISQPKCLSNVVEETLVYHFLVFAALFVSGFVLKEHSLRNWLVTKDKSSKEVNASWWSQFTFSWFDDTLALGSIRPLDSDDLNHLVAEDLSENINAEFIRTRKQGSPLVADLFWFNRRLLQQQSFFALISALLTTGSPFFLRQILRFVQDPSTVSHSYIAVLYAILLLISTATRSICDGRMYFLGRRIGLRVRSIIIMLIYKKSLLPISKSESDEKAAASAGKIVNLMSSDAFKILEVSCYLMYAWSTPLQAIICITFLFIVAGTPSIVGVIVMVVMIPTSGKIGSLVAKYQKNLMSATDIRINAITELLQSIRLVKFFAWESRFAENISKLRNNELDCLWSYIITNGVSTIIWSSTPIFVAFLTFSSMTVLAGQSLDAATAFTVLALFNVLRMPLQTFPDIIVKLSEAWVSLQRVESYLNERVIPSSANLEETDETVRILGDSSFSWYDSVPSNNSVTLHLKRLNLEFPVGGLTVIHGPTGAGKSSVLMALLGELNCVAGKGVYLGKLQKRSSHDPIAFAPQQVWLQNATIRENICFGTEFDAGRYQQVLAACALLKDFQNLDGGDMTEVGEKGVNLSGGQKARISLARAVYSYSPLILMDDPLSAVDAPTARHLFDKCICGPLLARRTKILVTHATSLCIPYADKAIRISKGSCNSSESDLSIYPIRASLVENLPNTNEDESEILAKQDSSLGVTRRTTSDESLSRGSVSFHIYWAYISAAGGIIYVFLLVLGYATAQILVIGDDWWLKTWADAYKTPSSTPGVSIDLGYYVGVYGLIGLAAMAAFLFRVIVISTGSIRASRNIHSRLVNKILRAPVQFFEKTPTGRILNRFSKDMKDIDQEVGFYCGFFIANVVSTVGILILILIVTPGTLYAVIPVLFVYIGIGLKYVRSSRELKRLDSLSRSPIFSHFSESISGSSVIRAYAAQQRFIDEAHKRVNTNHLAFFHLWVSNRWLSVRIELSGALVTFASSMSVIAAVISKYPFNAGLAGLSITYALSFSDAMVWLIRFHAMMEMMINSVERVDEYLQIEEEAADIIESSRPPVEWPQTGNIYVENLTISYSKEAEPILKHVSFQVNQAEKIAIVGRTGAGKTTLSLAFFRFVEFESGRIVIDGVDISRIGLYDLRSRLTVIPQDPILFSGTIRSNLDPLGHHTDQQIWDSLRHSHFLETMRHDSMSRSSSATIEGSESVGEPSFTIDSVVSEGGTNFSQGQRQLLCLARALLRKARIIIMDEATASVDKETDDKIQRTIREGFEKATLMTIAHRLGTIIDYDKVVVLDKGRVSQFGTPYELMIQTDSLFHSMCKESNEYEELLEVAKKHANKQ